MKKILSKIVCLIIACSTLSVVSAVNASAEKVNYKNDVPENYYSSLLEITNGNDDDKYYNAICSEPEPMYAVVPAETVRQFNNDNCLILLSTDYSSIPDEIREDETFDSFVSFELYVSDEIYYKYTFSLLERQAVTAKELRKLAGVPENEYITAIQIREYEHFDKNFEAADYEAFWDMIYSEYITGYRSTKCKSGAWCDFDGKRYYIKEDGSLARKSCTIKGIRYKISENGECLGKYTGWAKTSNGSKVYYKNGVRVTKNKTINGVRYKFNKKGICTGKYTGFVKSSKGRRYYKNGALLKDQKLTVKGITYYADSFGYLTDVEDDEVNPGNVSSNVRDLMYNGEKYYLFLSTEPFIYGDDGKCYVLGDLPSEVSGSGYKLKSKLTEEKNLTALIKGKKSVGQLKYTSKDLSNDFEITVKEFDKAGLYANGQSLDDYGLTIVSSEPFCYVDGTAVYLYTTATKY